MPVMDVTVVFVIASNVPAGRTILKVICRKLLRLTMLKECFINAAHLCSQLWVFNEELLDLRCAYDEI